MDENEFVAEAIRLSSVVEKCREENKRLNESTTIQVLILPFLEALGWNTKNPGEFQSEYRHNGTGNPVDIAFLWNKKPILFVEAKALDIDLNVIHLSQILNYANMAGVHWCGLTNGKEYRIYNVHARVEASKKQFFKICLNDFPKDPTHSIDNLAKMIFLISKDKMCKENPHIDVLWKKRLVDDFVQEKIEELKNNGKFSNFILRNTNQKDEVVKKDVQESLSRLVLSHEYNSDTYDNSYEKSASSSVTKRQTYSGRGRVSQYAGKRLYRMIGGNPRREGSHGFHSFSVIEDGMTYEEFVERGGRPKDLNWDIKKGNVEARDD